MARKMKLDFTGVESFQTASEGVHACKIVSADEKASSGGNDMIVVAFEVTKGIDKGARVYENYPLVDKALWKLKGLLQAIGMKADGKVQLDLDKLIGKVCSVTVKHEDYEGKTRARVDNVSKLLSDDVDEDEDFDEDEIEAEEAEEEEEEEEEKPAKKSKATKKKAAEPEPEEDEDEEDEWDDEDEDEEEEEPAPAPKKKAAKKEEKKPAKKATKKAAEEDDDDWDDDDWDEDDE